LIKKRQSDVVSWCDVKLIVGLGNPGREYEETRHNIGFMAVKEMACAYGIPLKYRNYQGISGRGRIGGNEVTLFLPQTFMNLSGSAVGSAVASLGLRSTDVVVVHDDLDIPFGHLRIRPEGGHGGHNGVRHILQVLKTGNFARVRIGIGRPIEGMDVADYVLQRFARSEAKFLDTILKTVVEAVTVLVEQSVDVAMNRFNNYEIVF